jgi:hypothetical protein
MDKKNQICNSEPKTLPHLGFAIGDMTSPDPEWHSQSNQQMRKSTIDIERTVKRIIAHLEED